MICLVLREGNERMLCGEDDQLLSWFTDLDAAQDCAAECARESGNTYLVWKLTEVGRYTKHLPRKR